MSETEGIRQRSQVTSWTRGSVLGLVLAGVALWDRGRDWGWLDTFSHVLGWVTTILWMIILAVVWVVAFVAWVRERRQ
jgi:tellurite resistance protein TehA-like permease